MRAIAEEAIKRFWLRPHGIMSKMARHLCNGKYNYCNEPYKLQYFIVYMNRPYRYKKDAFDAEKDLRKNL